MSSLSEASAGTGLWTTYTSIQPKVFLYVFVFCEAAGLIWLGTGH